MKDTAIIGRDVVGVKKEAFLHWNMSVRAVLSRMGTRVLHRLKLVTGVEISTRPVRRSGREGKAKKSMSRRAAAEVYRMAFRRSTGMPGDACAIPLIHSGALRSGCGQAGQDRNLSRPTLISKLTS